jgi:autotransporter-associated beta strand protein
MNVPNHPQTRYAKHFATLAALSLGILAQQASAADVTWVGNTSNLWNTGANWSTSAIPTNGDTLVFGAPGNSGSSLSDDIASLTVGGVNTDGIVFGPAASSYTLARSGSTQVITLGSSGSGIAVKNTSLFLQTISAPLTFTGDQTIQVGETTGASLSSLSTGTGVLIGGFRLTKTGNGLLTLGSNNVLSGLTIKGGIVSIGSDAQLSTTAPASATPGWLVLDGGALRTNIASITISDKRGIALGNATAGSGGTIFVSQGTTVGTNGTVYNGIISNNGAANSLTKSGVGILVLGGANTYTGATIVNQGQLTLDFSASGAPTSNIISSSSALVLGGIPNLMANTSAGSPILYTQGNNSVATTQTFNGTTIDFGNANVIAHAGAGTSNTTIDLGTVTHNAGGTVAFSTMTNGSTGVGVLKASNTAGILGGWATTAAGAGTGTAALAQTDWAAVDGSGNIVAYAGYTTPTGAAPAIVSNSASNLKLDGTSSGTSVLSAGTTELNTILVSDGTASRTITVGTGNTLRLGVSAGIWKSSTTNTAININGGTLTAGGSTANTAGEIVLNSGSGAATFNATISISSVIANNGSGAVSVVKTGTASTTLTGSNTYSGGTFVNQGTLAVSNSLLTNVFGTGSVTIAAGAQVALTSNATKITYANAFNIAGTALNMYGNTISGDITLLGDSQITSNSTDGGAVSGKISGDFSVSFTRGMHTLSNTGNDYSGNIGINGNSPTATGILLAAASGIKLGASEVLANGVGKGNLVISASAATTGTLDMNGYNETINGLISAGTIAGTAPLAIVTNTNTTASQLTLGDNDQTTTYAGTIVDGAGTVRIVKIGKGIQTFSGLNTYTGGTAVDAGTLAIGNSFTMSGANRISIAATGLAGTNYATVKSTSGTLTFGGTLGINITASLSGGESFNLFTANGGALAGDFGTTAGNVSLTGSYIASLTNNGSGIWTGTTSGLDFTFSTSGVNAGILSVAVSSVPEPSTYAALFGTLVLGVSVMQRRRSKKSV